MLLPVSSESLTPNELAARWCLRRITVYDLIAWGHLPFYQLGGSFRVKWADVRAYEETVYRAAVMCPKRLRQKRRRVYASTRGPRPRPTQGVEA